MHRRDFLNIAAMTGLAVAAPRRAKAAFSPYGGPYYVFVSARGGWDPNYFCNPKVKDPARFNRLYDYAPDTHKVGNLPYANIPVSGVALGLDAMADPYLMTAKDFLAAHGAQTLVLNGINCQTNNHDRGFKTTFSGRGDRDFPALAAMIAADRAPGHPLAFISSGGYANSGNLLPVTRLSSVGAFQKIANPNKVDVNNPDSATYHSPENFARITDAQAARLGAIEGAEALPRIKASAGELYLARSNMDALSLVDLPTTLVDLPNNIGDLERMMQQTQLALAAFQAGLAVSANLELGGFDTHASHDINQVRQLAKLLHGIHFLFQQAEALGLLNELIVVVGSDFGRGKSYNGPGAADGKDHWPVTSMLVMSGDPSVVGGDRLVGATTDEDNLPMTVDPMTLETLAPDEGTEMTFGTVHRALRRFAGIDDQHPLWSKFPLVSEDVGIFG
ncbi:MAG: DUF1501 domain-containing protein [Nannocystaceae bacterium]